MRGAIVIDERSSKRRQHGHQRFFGIATLTLHTAGSHNASVTLPGLGEELAREMREDIRAHIRRESL